jgi:two-component system chemotaxis response regulator CheY
VSEGRKSPSRSGNLKEIRDAAANGMIFVIEDDPDLASALCDLLRISGYRAAHAVDGIAALEMLGDSDLPDLILLDLMLPRLDGWGFRERQLADNRLSGIPVVVLSAVGEIVRPIKADHLLRKPVAPDTLLASIERFRLHRPA